MRRFSKTMVGFVSAVLGGAAVFAAVHLTSIAREAEPPPQFNIQDAPINRDARVATSYAPIIKRSAPSVVNIYSSRTVRQQQLERHPFFNDPMFRRFFGPNFNFEDEDGPMPRRTPRPRTEQGLGSGVIVSPNGYILTASHVVEGADEVKVALPTGRKELIAKVIGTDRATDVAVLKIDAQDLPAIPIADSDKLEVGDVLIAIGNPFGVGQTVTMGIVSAVGRTSLGITDYEDFIQTDAAINPGNSGGALIDAEGRLVGINTAIFSRSGGFQGVGFAVPVNMARGVMERLIQHGKVTRGYLGIGLQPEISPELAQVFRLPDLDGAMASEVMPNTPAAKAGLRAGDVIREVDGRKITDSSQLRLLISQKAPGTKVSMKILRGQRGRAPTEQTVTATLGTLPENAQIGMRELPGNGDSEPAPDALDGVEVSDLNPSIRQRFNIPDNVQGAIVTDVDPESTAADGGLRVGDVIQEINQQPVRSADDAVALAQKEESDQILLRAFNGRASRYVVVQNSKKVQPTRE